MSDSTPEEWRPVVGYEGLYEISDQGRVRSVPHEVRSSDGRRIWVSGKIRKPQPQHHGHLKIQLLRNGHQESVHVHTLVLTGFVGPRPDGMCCRHLNGVSSDNRLENLAWGTYSENKFDQVRHGTDAYASRTHCPHGHPYDETNTVRSKRQRHCRECMRQRCREYRQRKKAA